MQPVLPKPTCIICLSLTLQVVHVMSGSIDRAEFTSFLFTVVVLSIFVTTSCTTTDRGKLDEQVRMDRGAPKSHAPPARTSYPTLRSIASDDSWGKVCEQRCTLQSVSQDVR